MDQFHFLGTELGPTPASRQPFSRIGKQGMGCDGWSHELTLSPERGAFAQHLLAGIHNQLGATIKKLARKMVHLQQGLAAPPTNRCISESTAP